VQGKGTVVGLATATTKVDAGATLSSTFAAGPRHMQQLYQDAIALSVNFGKADLFVTMTTNPDWPEIQACIPPGHAATDYPEIVSWVFNLKLKELTADLFQRHVLGKVNAHLFVVEFQKRGLPHTHILIFLDPADKFRVADDADAVVSAEIPDQSTHPRLHEIVVTTMLHGPCGNRNPSAPCMENGRCTKGYPRNNLNETVFDKEDYATYWRRPGTTVTVKHRGQEYVFTNRDVVPYNAYLSLKYNCHINVEVCSRIESIKYLYKYVYKGHDRARGRLQPAQNQPDGQAQAVPPAVDEIAEYIDGRYVSSSEACWRLFGFTMSAQYPNVVRLPVYALGERSVTFQEDATAEDLQELLEYAELKGMLEQWFVLNSTDESARQHLYRDIPHHYVWIPMNRKRGFPGQWRRRKRGNGVGRIYNVSIRRGDAFYVRLLLLKIPGATSFKDLCRIPDDLCVSVTDAAALEADDGSGRAYARDFKEACRILGLIDDDKEWDQALAEGVTFQNSKQLRELFVLILCDCNPSSPLGLWEKYKKNMADDYLYQERCALNDQHLELSDDMIFDALRDIQERLQRAGKRLQDYGLAPPPERTRPRAENQLIADQLAYAANPICRQEMIEELDAKLRPFLPEQGRVYVNFCAALGYNAEPHALASFGPPTLSFGANEAKSIFIDGPGGTGKTFVFHALLAKVRSQGKIALAVASSGIAAILLPGGATAHSTLKIPLSLGEDSVCFIDVQGPVAALLRQTDVILWDEFPMISRYAVEAVDCSLQDVMRSEVPFGGIPMIFGGDFRQILPVVKHGGPADIIDQCVTRSYLWRHMKSMKLSVNMRVMKLLALVRDRENRQEMGAAAAQAEARKLQDYADFLLRVGEGRKPTYFPGRGESLIRLPDEICFQGESLDDLISSLYSQDDIQSGRIHQLDFLVGRGILTPRNKDVDAINEKIMALFPSSDGSPARKLYARDTLSAENPPDATIYPPEFMASFHISGLPPATLELMIGSIVMLLRNMDGGKGQANGTRAIVRQIRTRVMEVEIATGISKGERVLIPRIVLDARIEESGLPFNFQRRQFPVRPAFAMTINKAQGQTMSCVGVYLPEPVFSHGQLYVGFSRVGSPDAIKVLVKGGSIENRGIFTSNIVYQEVRV
jgi:hypothetical protein